jgi:predicted O-methyltransferase YrrM
MSSLRKAKWSMEQALARACYKFICRLFPEMRVYGDTMLPRVGQPVDWKSGLGDARWILYGAVRAMRPEVVVEIGSARGMSTCIMGAARRINEKGKVYAIDPNTPNDWSEFHTGGDNYEFLKARVHEYGLDDWCEIIRKTSGEAGKDWKRPIDFLFIDGDHSYAGVKLDFETFSPYLTERAVVAFHDSAWGLHTTEKGFRDDMGVPTYIEELKKQGYETVTFAEVPGLTLMHPRRGGFSLVHD